MTDANSKTILLIEDSNDDVVLLKRVIARAGIAYPIQVVSDGAEAIKYLNREAPFQDRSKFPLPYIILTDIKMPKRTGFDVLEWIRRNPECRGIPTIILTSSSQESDVVRAYDMGATAYIVKPAEGAVLDTIVHRLFSFWEVCRLPAGKF